MRTLTPRAGDAAAADASTLGDLPLRDVATRSDADAPRLYVTGILGDSFATLTDPLYASIARSRLDGSIITAGGAAGMAYAAENGQWRFEIEGRGRDDLTAVKTLSAPPVALASFHWAAADGWSAMANVWRDWWIGERWAAYAGGGIGGGGYRYSLTGDLRVFDSQVNFAGNAQVAEFAWQVGGGVVYEISERVSFDIGYRFFSIGQANVTYLAYQPEPVIVDTRPQQFTAGEVLFSLRVYEPFRRWR